MLAGCAGLSRSSFDAAKLALKRDALAIDAAQVAASPWAQIRVDGPHGASLMVLGNDDAGLTSWYSPDRKIVFLRGGILAGTEGLDIDAVEICMLGENPFTRLSAVTVANTKRRYDWAPGYRHGVVLRGELRQGPIENIEILGVSRQLRRFDESLRGSGFEALNRYWADPSTGAILRSRQFVSPGMYLEISVLKPYISGAVP
ncbi:hypothetical protein AO715_02935 [Xanthomonas sp. Mitacek01]|nr:hypothetical protein AO715_02935 [Xanthomonas sp. Mitacek01]